MADRPIRASLRLIAPLDAAPLDAAPLDAAPLDATPSPHGLVRRRRRGRSGA
jgi:hypothetical protein